MPEPRNYRYQVLAALLVSTLVTAIGGMNIRLRCNDYIEKVYVQDKEKTDIRGWRETVQLSVSDEASIIGVQWLNVGGTTPALIASASTGIVSDDINWKCTTTQLEDNWYEEHFDSRGWGNTSVVCRNDNCGNLSDSSFPGNASWIRSTEGILAGRTYCRGQLGPVSLTVVYPRSSIAALYTDGVELFFERDKGVNIKKQTLTHTPKLIAVRNRRRKYDPGWTIVSMSNGFISGKDWKCKQWSWSFNNKQFIFQNLDFEDTSWDSAVVVPQITGDYEVIDNDAKIWWTADNSKNEQDCFCRGTVGLSAYVYCNDRGHVYVDGVKMNEEVIERDWRSVIPRTARLIAIEVENTFRTKGVRATFSNGFQTSGRWKCSTISHDRWYTIEFNDSTGDWKNARIQEPDSPDYIWEQSDRNGFIYCRGWIECGCGPNFRCIPSPDSYNYKCVCREGHSGETCEDTAVKCSDRGAVCGDHGQCVDIDDFYVCLCGDGYAGDECDSDINECASNPCQHNTSCSNTIGSFNCECTNSGYEGPFCEDEIDECRSGPCQNGGNCTDLFKNFTCNCANIGYEDRICSTEINECDSNPCQNSGKCKDKVNHFECDCTGTGYEGPTCSLDVDECLKSLPQCVNGTCVNSEGSYNCTCASGFTGLRCETDIDECADSNLNQCTTKCLNNPGGYTCECDDGYELQGKYDCVDTNECEKGSHTCSDNCTNTAGSFTCFCADGIQLMRDGHTCQVSKTQGGGTTLGLAAGVSVVLFVLIAAVVAVVILFYRRRTRQQTKDNESVHRQNNFSNHAAINPEFLADTATSNEYENVKELRKLDEDPNVEQSRRTEEEEEDDGAGKQPKQSTSTPDAANKKTDHATLENEEPVYSNVGVEAPVSRPIRVGDLSVYVKRKLDGHGFKTEFESIPKGNLGECSAAERDGIKPKLRFKNILPYDYNRVVLSKIPGQALSDFVNASYVNVYRDQKYYIATQGPKKKILDEFWRMVWEQNVSLIVMVTNFVEAGVPKCDRYWPEGSKDTYNEFTVTIKEKQEMLHFTFQTFSLEKDGESRQVKHCHFKTWPDKGVPGTGSSLLEFRRQIKKIEKDCPPPIVIHCSAGVGRTGTYIALDYLLQQAEAEGVVDVCGCVNFLRESRMHMIQTLDQYTFLHSVLLEALTVGVTAIPCSKFTQKYSILKKVHPTTKTSKLQDQFKLLETLKPSYDPINYSESLCEESNAAKNRDASILPVNQFRPCLSAKREAPSDYINAVFADGYHSRREFVVTQMPLEKTVVDVWRLVADFGIRTIVQLQEEADVSYFPEDIHATLDTGLFSIKNLSTKTEDQMNVRALLVAGSDRQEDIKVNHITLTGWPSLDALPKEPGHLLAAFRSMQKQQQQQQQGATTAPILIVCLNGVERSGLFCAVCVMMDQINGHQEVDIFNSVRDIRQSRPQFIPTQEQYKYLHEIARTYVAGFDLYANFQ